MPEIKPKLKIKKFIYNFFFKVGLIFGIIAAFIASSKGFKSLRWILALGIIGFITVIFMPSARVDGITPEEAERRASKANNVGAWMACVLNWLQEQFCVLKIKRIYFLRKTL